MTKTTKIFKYIAFFIIKNNIYFNLNKHLTRYIFPHLKKKLTTGTEHKTNTKMMQQRLKLFSS